MALLGTWAFYQSGQQKRFVEIDVERLNVVEADGTVRLVIANRERAPDHIMDGRTRPREESNKSAGITFFNDEGDEAGGLKIRAGTRDGAMSAGAHLLFDQYKQDQTLGLTYQETDGRRSVGMTVWDRPDTPLPQLVDEYRILEAMPETSVDKNRPLVPAIGDVWASRKVHTAASISCSKRA